MTVLAILGILIGLFLIYMLTQKLNDFTMHRFNESSHQKSPTTPINTTNKDYL